MLPSTIYRYKNGARTTLPVGGGVVDGNQDVWDVAAGGGAELPDQTSLGSVLGVYNSSDFRSPEEAQTAGALEYVLLTEKNVDAQPDRIRVSRGAEGTTGIAHNSPGKVYRIFQSVTAGAMEQVGWSLPLNVRAYGAVGDGVTDDTDAIRAAIADADGNNLTVKFPQGSYLTRMSTLNSGSCRLVGYGATIIQSHDESSVQISGDWTISSVFLCQRGSSNVRIEGFRFTQDSSFDALPHTSASWFAPIAVHRANAVEVRECEFAPGTGVGVHIHGGDGCAVRDNRFESAGMTAHVGFEQNVFFGDPASDTGTVYSPLRLRVTGNHFDGSLPSVVAALVHLTGCDDFVCSSNAIDAVLSGRGIRAYANDFGMSVGGTPTAVMRGVIQGNVVRGTLTEGIELEGESQNSTNVDTLVVIDSNVVEITGRGISARHARKGRVSGNRVVTTASPLLLASDCSGLQVEGNLLECTSNSANSRTIQIDSDAVLEDVVIDGNVVDTPAADQYAMDVVSGSSVEFDGGAIRNNLFRFRSTDASARVLQLRAIGGFELSGNEFLLIGSGITDRFIASVVGTDVRLSLRGNLARSVDPASPNYSRGISVVCEDLQAIGNDCHGLDATVTECAVSGNLLRHEVSLVSPLSISGARFAAIEGNRIEHEISNNVPAVLLDSCTVAVFSGNFVGANTTTDAVRLTTSGELQVRDNAVVNPGGGAEFGVTGTATLGGDLGNFTTAGRPSAADCAAGARIYNTDQSRVEYSDGAVWRDAVGAAV